jgi:hypothetical protein
MCEEMINDLKFSFACQSKSKPGKKKNYDQSVNSRSYNSLSEPQIIKPHRFNKINY